MVLYPHLGQYVTFIVFLFRPFLVNGFIFPADFIVPFPHSGHFAIGSPPGSCSVEVEYCLHFFPESFCFVFELFD